MAETTGNCNSQSISMIKVEGVVVSLAIIQLLSNESLEITRFKYQSQKFGLTRGGVLVVSAA